jgi:hypothetical protein
MCASSSQSRRVNDLDQTLEDCQTLLCLQEMDLEVREEILAEELQRALHPPDGWDMSVDLDKAHTGVDRIDGECAIEAEKLSW